MPPKQPRFIASAGGLCYLVPPFVLASLIGEFPAMGYVFLPLLAVSWYEDWKCCSAAANASTIGSSLDIFDVVTAANYVAFLFAIARSQEPITHGFSIFVSVQWLLLFLIYAVWNIRLSLSADEESRRMFLGFTAVEVIILFVVAVTLFVRPDDSYFSVATYWALLGVTYLGHWGLIFVWRHMSRDRSPVPNA